MNQIEKWDTDLLNEKSLSDVFRKSRSIVSSKSNDVIFKTSVFFALCYIVAIANYDVDNSRITDAISRASSLIASLSVSILGFLIAGFSIFATITNKELLRKLAQTRYKKTNLSQFKYIFFNFINVFSVFLFALAFSQVIFIVTPLGWAPFIEQRQILNSFSVEVFNSIILSALCIVSLYSFLRLKSFIWSLYQSILITTILDDAKQ
jgi:hypothetical protein